VRNRSAEFKRISTPTDLLALVTGRARGQTAARLRQQDS
jgi:hypothetical protein